MTIIPTDLLIRRVVLSSTGSAADIHIKNGKIFRIVAADQEDVEDVERLDLQPRSVIEGNDHVLFPSFVEPHAHLDKVFIIDENIPPGDLHAAIDLFKRRYYSTMDGDDIYARALAAIKIAVARGITTLRTHVDVGASAGVLALEPILALKEELRDVIDVQVVALVLPPALEERQKSVLIQAIEAGVDALGGCPTLESQPRETIDWVLSAAREARLAVDFHLDEAADARSVGLAALLDSLDAGGAQGNLAASHCVSLGNEEEADLGQLLLRMRDHNVGLVTLPQTNLLLQARDTVQSKPRGMPPLRPIIDAGLTLAAGGDNWRDPFNPLSRIDPVETISLLVSAGHLDPAEAVGLVTDGARSVLNIPDVQLQEGMPADLVAIKGETAWSALANASDQRLVIKNGVVVSRTKVIENLHPVF